MEQMCEEEEVYRDRGVCLLEEARTEGKRKNKH
jgi:hypothetical protein